jgi:hypothetical protein
MSAYATSLMESSKDAVIEEALRQLSLVKVAEAKVKQLQARNEALERLLQCAAIARSCDEQLGENERLQHRITVRKACRRRMPLDGTDAQALEHALTITERERDEALAEVERLRVVLAKEE